MPLEKPEQLISELKAKLKEQQFLVDSLNNIIDLSVVGILIVDSQQRILLVNNTACLMLGLNKAELEGELFGAPIIPEDHIEITFIGEDHQLGKAEMKVTDSTYLKQNVKIISLHDITERKKLEINNINLQLYENQNHSTDFILDIAVEKAAEITESEIAFLSILDEDESLKEATHVFSKNIPIKNNQKTDSKLYFPEMESIWRAPLDDKEPVIINNITSSHSLAENILVSSSLLTRIMKIPILENDKVTALIAVANKSLPYDETDVENLSLLIKNALRIVSQKKTEEESEKLKKIVNQSMKMDALGNLAGGISHDFNNMLGVILGYADLLEGSLINQQPLVKYIHEIQNAANRSVHLTSKLLSFSKSDETKPEPIDLNALLMQQQDMLEKTLTARIELKFEMLPELWNLLLDKNDLEDAVLNISINAMHAMEGSGCLRFRTSNEVLTVIDAKQFSLQPGDYVLLSITDTGCGIEKTIIDKIFEPFFTTKDDKGTGLGLSQVYGFVKRSKGIVKVYSEINMGTQFVFYFPRYNKNSDVLFIDNDLNKQDISGNETILVVDDEPSLVNLSAEILSLKGYNVLCANDGAQALTILETENIDLMLSDIIMPNMDGYQLAALVKEKYPHMKIQLTSGFSDIPYIQSTTAELVKSILPKPYSAEALLKAVRACLDKN